MRIYLTSISASKQRIRSLLFWRPRDTILSLDSKVTVPLSMPGRFDNRRPSELMTIVLESFHLWSIEGTNHPWRVLLMPALRSGGPLQAKMSAKLKRIIKVLFKSKTFRRIKKLKWQKTWPGKIIPSYSYLPFLTSKNQRNVED